MQKINGYPKNLVTLLGSRYFIPYYQREYKWEKKQMLELDSLDPELRTKYYGSNQALPNGDPHMLYVGEVIAAYER